MRTLLTGEDLFRRAGDGRFDLVEGELLELTPPGAEHGEVCVNTAAVLKQHVRASRFGRVFSASGFYLRRNPDTVRGPDLSFYSFERLPAGTTPKGYLEVPPDLVVEVVSPNDTAEELESRVQELLQIGVREVWILHPGARSVTVHRPEGIRRFGEDDTLVGGDVLPSFQCEVRRFFEDA